MSIHEDLKAYVDGELSPERDSEVRAAVERDPQLQHEVQMLKALGQQIKALASEPIPIGAEEALQRLRRPTFTEKLVRVPVTWACAATLFLVSLGLFAIPALQGPSMVGLNNAIYRSESAAESTGAAPSEQPLSDNDARQVPASAAPSGPPKGREKGDLQKGELGSAGTAPAARSDSSPTLSSPPTAGGIDSKKETLENYSTGSGMQVEANPPVSFNVNVPDAVVAQSKAADYFKQIGGKVQTSPAKASRNGRITELNAQVPQHLAEEAAKYVVSSSQADSPIEQELDKSLERPKWTQSPPDQVQLNFVFEEQKSKAQRGRESRAGTIGDVTRSRAAAGVSPGSEWVKWTVVVTPILLFFGWLGLRFRMRF